MDLIRLPFSVFCLWLWDCSAAYRFSNPVRDGDKQGERKLN
jgi:hypothetical protein